jgi:hypothetical protein
MKSSCGHKNLGLDTSCHSFFCSKYGITPDEGGIAEWSSLEIAADPGILVR